MTDAAAAAASTVAAAAAADLLPPATPADQARAQIEALKANPEWVKRHLGGDHATREELARLHELTHTPAPGSIISGMPTAAAQNAEMADHLSTLFDISPGIMEEIRQGKPASLDEHRLAVGRKAARMSDPAWVNRYMTGDAEARREMWLLNSILTRR
jgi:hypothetical protein